MLRRCCCCVRAAIANCHSVRKGGCPARRRGCGLPGSGDATHTYWHCQYCGWSWRNTLLGLGHQLLKPASPTTIGPLESAANYSHIATAARCSPTHCSCSREPLCYIFLCICFSSPPPPLSTQRSLSSQPSLHYSPCSPPLRVCPSLAPSSLPPSAGCFCTHTQRTSLARPCGTFALFAPAKRTAAVEQRQQQQRQRWAGVGPSQGLLGIQLHVMWVKQHPGTLQQAREHSH